MITVESLTKRYGKHCAIDNLNFTINRDEITGFLGPNGAGKSTTMNVITGYIAAGEGRVTVAGLDVLENPEEVKRLIGYLPEQPPLYQEMTVNEYIEFVAALKDVDALVFKRDKEKIFDLIKIADVSSRLIRNLSKGYKQRVGLAAAMIGSPPILILDEPTVGLDPQQMLEIRSLIGSLRGEHTVVLSSHILSEVQAVCDRALIINKGRIVANDTPDNLAKNVKGGSELTIRVKGEPDVVENAFSSVEQIRRFAARPCEEPGCVEYELIADDGADIRADVFFCLAKINAPLMSMRAGDVSLEEIFLALTAEASA